MYFPSFEMAMMARNTLAQSIKVADLVVGIAVGIAERNELFFASVVQIDAENLIYFFVADV